MCTVYPSVSELDHNPLMEVYTLPLLLSFFHQPAPLSLPPIFSFSPLLTSTSVQLTTGSWTHQWESPVCGLDTGWIVSVGNQRRSRTYTNISITLTSSRWSTADFRVNVGDFTASYGAESVCGFSVCIEESVWLEGKSLLFYDDCNNIGVLCL